MTRLECHGLVASQPFRVGFVLLEKFTLIALASAIEPLRMANQLRQKQLYQWDLLSETGGSVNASGGIQMMPDKALDQAEDYDLILVVAGVDVRQHSSFKVLDFLKVRSHSLNLLGGLCTGPLVLAQAGLLDGYSCSAHWECLAALQEEHPRVYCNNNLFTFDRNRITCTGGDVSLHMMLHLVGNHHGAGLANEISDMFVCDRIRESQEPQRLRMQKHVFTNQPKLANAVELMEANIEEPIEVSEVAAYSGISRRQLERLFLNFLGTTPSRFYLKVRLERAQQLLRQTTCSIVDIASMCGFDSTTHFTRTYRKYMSRAPKTERVLSEAPGANLVFTEEAAGLVSEAVAMSGLATVADSASDLSKH
jgi:transcriptional regulator GlxA family with amidase domain